MRLLIPFCWFILTIIIQSCSGSTEKKQQLELEKLAKEVMDIHDRTMADYGKLYGLKKKLLNIYELEVDTLRRRDIDKLIADLEKSDKDMMDWMHEYHEPEDYLPFTEKRAYYLEQKAIIADVENLTRASIENAKSMIAKYPDIK